MDKAAQKRLALSRDQRSVLEAVYAVEKLPDAALRDRLSKYLDLSTRQIQVWFQNRRQRAKASGTTSPPAKKLNNPSQIMDALFEFTGNVNADASSGLLAPGATRPNGDAPPNPVMRSSSSNGSGSTESPPSNSLDCETFEWGLPQQSMPPQSHSGSSMAPVAMRAGLMVPHGDAQEIGASTSAPPPVWAATDILDAVLGFACHEMCLEAVELWPLPTASGPATEPLFAHFSSPVMGMECNSDLACCRAMLAPRLCESAACTHELAWYGVTAEQKEAFARTGVSLRNLVGVPCLEPPNGTTTTLPVNPSICAILVLYTRIELPQSEAYNMLLHALGSAAAAAYALGLSKPKPSVMVPAPNYASVPTDGPATSLSWLLLAAARALQVDIAEHWTARQSSRGGGVYMSAEQLLVSQRVHNLPDTVLATGEQAEALHPFSSHMSRATLYAGKLVWCNGTSASGALEGVKLPVQTAVGLPLRSHVGGGAAFVLYSMRRLEQSTSVTYFIAQLQVLAAASHAANSQSGGFGAASSAARTDDGARTTASTADASGSQYGGAAGAPAASSSTASALDSAPEPPSTGAPSHDMWVTPEAVMSTEQVLSLIDCLGPEKAAAQAAAQDSLGSRKGSSLALDALGLSTTESDAARDESALGAAASSLLASGCTADDLTAALCV